MTEQEAVTPTPTDETARTAETHTAAIKITSPTTKRKAVKTSTKVGTQTDEEKRLARNAALREWRRKNADHMKAYMAEWRAKRKGEQPSPALQTTQSVPGAVRSTASLKPRGPGQVAKRSASSKPKKAGKK